VEFLVFRVWIGIWLAIIGAVTVLLEGSFIAKYFSRFVQEIFAILIALLFIVDAFTNVIKVQKLTFQIILKASSQVAKLKAFLL